MKGANILVLAALGVGAYFLLKKNAYADVSNSGATGFVGSQGNTGILPVNLQPIFTPSNPISPNESLKAISFETTSSYAAGTRLGQSLPSYGTPNTYSPTAGIGYTSTGQGYSAAKPITEKKLTSSPTTTAPSLNTYLRPEFRSKPVF